MTGRSPVRRGMAIAVAAACALLAGACGDDADEVAGAPAGPFTGCEIVSGSADTPVATLRGELGDYVVGLSAGTVKAGAVRFEARNVGQRPHELVVVKGADVASLPRDKDGSMAEEKLPDLALAGEIEEFPTGEACAGTFDLEPGSYVVFCNLVEKVGGTKVVHLQKGMATTLTVTA